MGALERWVTCPPMLAKRAGQLLEWQHMVQILNASAWARVRMCCGTLAQRLLPGLWRLCPIRCYCLRPIFAVCAEKRGYDEQGIVRGVLDSCEASGEWFQMLPAHSDLGCAVTCSSPGRSSILEARSGATPGQPIPQRHNLDSSLVLARLCYQALLRARWGHGAPALLRADTLLLHETHSAACNLRMPLEMPRLDRLLCARHLRHCGWSPRRCALLPGLPRPRKKAILPKLRRDRASEVLFFFLRSGAALCWEAL